MELRYTAAAIQFEPELGNRDRNMAALERLIRDAALTGARLVVAPEMATTGYCFRNRAELRPLVEPIPGGPTTARFGALARELGIYLVIGLPEVDPATDAYYNSAILLDPDGALVGSYRKTHLYLTDTLWAREGDQGIPVFDTAIGRIAILICMDAEFFETARLATLAGAEVICFPTNWLGSPPVAWYSRALENRVYLVAADRWGEERGTRFTGESAVIGPDGKALGLLTRGDGVVSASIDLRLARDKRHPLAGDLLQGRRPECYQELLLHQQLWHPSDLWQLPAGDQPVIALAQFTPRHDPSGNLARMGDLARWADLQARERTGRPADLVLFPEGALGPVAEPVPGPATGALAELARSLNCHLCWGMFEADGEQVYSTAVLVGPDGLVGRYRRLHLLPWERPGGPAAPVPQPGPLRAGSEPPPCFDLPWGRVGLLLGADLYYPEAARLVAKGGADLCLAPAAWVGTADRLLWADRWATNDMALAVCNQTGPATGGGSRLYGEPGRRNQRLKLGDADGATGCMALELGARSTFRHKELLRKLRPQWYGPLARVHPAVRTASPR